MKLTIPIIGVLATVAVLASVGGIYAYSFDSEFGSLGTSSGPQGAAMMTGNVKVLHLDENGDVKGIRHGANHIVMGGMAIIMGQVFSGVNATLPDNLTDCLPAFCDTTPPNENNVTGRVGWMQIGTSGDPGWANQVTYNQTDVLSPIGQSGSGAFTCGRVAAVIGNQTAGTGPAHGTPSHRLPGGSDPQANLVAAQMNVTAIADFEGSLGCDVASIDEAGIFTDDDEVGGLMFARNTFGSVTLGDMDTLQLQWQFTFTDDIS